MTAVNLTDLQDAIVAVAPITGISLSDPDDPTTCAISFASAATDAQKTAAAAVVAGWTLQAARSVALQTFASQVAQVQTAGHLFAAGPLSGLHLAVRPNTSDEANWLVLLEMCSEQVAAGNGAVTIPSGPSPVTVEGSAPSMSYAQGQSAMNELMAWGGAVLAQEEALATRINAAQSVAALQAISLTTGWPT